MKSSRTRLTGGLFGLVILAGCSAHGGLGRPGAESAPEWQERAKARIDFEAAAAALASEDRHLAAVLLRELRDGSDGHERRYYSALLLSAAGQEAEARAEMQTVVSESAEDSLPPWLWSDLVERLGEDRLAARRAEAERELQALLNRHYGARGGLEHLRSLTDMVVLGTARSQSAELRFRLIRKRPTFYRLDLYRSDGRHIEAADGQVAWRLLPPYQPDDGSFLDGEERQRMLDDSHFDDPLLRYPETGERLFLAGKETVADHQAERIEIEGASGKRITVFLDRESGLEVRRLIWGEPGAPPTVVTVEQGDFDRSTLPARQIVESPNGVVEYLFESYDFDSSLDPAAFDLEHVRQLEASRLVTGNKPVLPPKR